MQTLFVEGEVGTSMLKEQSLGKTPFSISLTAAVTNGKQMLTASLKSLSWLSSFFLQEVRPLRYQSLRMKSWEKQWEKKEGKKEGGCVVEGKKEPNKTW